MRFFFFFLLSLFLYRLFSQYERYVYYNVCTEERLPVTIIRDPLLFFLHYTCIYDNTNLLSSVMGTYSYNAQHSQERLIPLFRGRYVDWTRLVRISRILSSFFIVMIIIIITLTSRRRGVCGRKQTVARSIIITRRIAFNNSITITTGIAFYIYYNNTSRARL